MDFKALKSKRKTALADLQNTMTEQFAKKSFKTVDEKMWKPTVDKTKNGHAIIRFLPPKDGDVPYVRIFSHGFKDPKTNQYYIENSRTTIGEPDPCGEYNTQLWNAGDEASARRQKRKLQFVCNILVIKDRLNPETEGKVFTYSFGKKIFEKIQQVMAPPFDEDGNPQGSENYDPKNAFNPFDMWEGANFVMRITHDEFRNYDQSSFDPPKPLGTEEEMEEVFNLTYNINDYIAPDKFKSYNDLKTRLHKVIGLADAPSNQVAVDDYVPAKEEESTPFKSMEAPPPPIEPEDELAKLLAEISDDK